MSLNTRKQRNHLYGISFLKWSLEERLSQFKGASIEASLAIHKFYNNAEKDTYDNLCTALSDFETLLEVAEETFPDLRSKIDNIKKSKLIILKKHTIAEKHIQKAATIKEKTKAVSELIKKPKKSFFKRLFSK